MWRSRKLQFFRFIFSGVLNSLFGWVCFSAAVFFGASILVALIIGASLGAAFNFLTHSTITFGDLSVRKIPTFMLVYAFIISINYAALLMMMALVPEPILAQLIVTPLIALFSYFIFTKWVFVG
ncbi:GtrA family protein [Planktotalea arctica]|uniref:GtrA family protein n=1 Tax=Planktotalea arctica TaxID=1481893 RepID=UPI000A17487B|nr:GtrA family protein [Planktotalea arctica]